jgi:hypothetical protein
MNVISKNLFLYLSRKDRSLAQYASLSTQETSETKESELETGLPRYEEVPNPILNWRTQCVRVVTIGASIFVCSLAVVFLVRSYQSTHLPVTASLHCGTSNTTIEARDLGCEFDMLSYSWTPKQCFDKDTASEFRDWLQSSERQMGEFPFFYDVVGNDHVLGEEELSESFGTTIYTTQEEHLGHCTFMMRRLHRVAESLGRLRLNSRYGTLEHTKHCSEEVLLSFKRPDPRDMGGIHARFGVSFEHC